ncbi:hypothetical protein [Polynucleobacter sp.]|uniref:hypothetical protein n=1 Tax=Polynucleobacter sp. TaxID=2029855 RepID=UPI003F6A3825
MPNHINHKYLIHDLVCITISSDVHPEIIREIDFQIGAFKIDNEISHTACSHSINIFPFSHAQQFINEGSKIATFYDSKGMVGKSIWNQKDSLFIGREKSGFLICADYANFLINLYIQILIVDQRLTMIHAAAYKNSSGMINVLTGAGGIGKTAVLGYAVGERGLQHLGDDIVMLSDRGLCNAFPREFVLKTYHREIYSEVFKSKSLPTWNAYSIKRFLVENAPFVGVMKSTLKKLGIYYSVASLLRPQSHLATIPPDELFGHGSLALNGKVGLIAYMDRTSSPDFSIEQISAEVMVNRITSVIHYEWKDFTGHLFTLGALDVINFPKYLSQVADIVKNASNEAQLVQINIPNNAAPNDLIEFLDRNNFFS